MRCFRSRPLSKNQAKTTTRTKGPAAAIPGVHRLGPRVTGTITRLPIDKSMTKAQFLQSLRGRGLGALLTNTWTVVQYPAIPCLLLYRYFCTSAYFRKNRVRKLHIGSQQLVLPGWLNTEFGRPCSWRQIYLDARRRFPFQDNSFAYVFSEHMIEHVSYCDGLHMLSECKRILRPGGKIRIATPDLARIIRAYFSGDAEAREYVEWSRNACSLPASPGTGCHFLNHFVRSWGHMFIYDRLTLREALSSAGFEAIVEYNLGQSADASLTNLECHHLNIGEANNRFETMVMEAQKSPV
jgi:predicted SAM-dependent methyltransferase